MVRKVAYPSLTEMNPPTADSMYTERLARKIVSSDGMLEEAAYGSTNRALFLVASRSLPSCEPSRFLSAASESVRYRWEAVVIILYSSGVISPEFSF